MRVTVDIEDKKLAAILKLTHQTKKSPAIAAALDAYLEQKKRQTFLDKVLAGQTSYATGNDELETLSRLDDQ